MWRITVPIRTLSQNMEGSSCSVTVLRPVYKLPVCSKINHPFRNRYTCIFVKIAAYTALYRQDNTVNPADKRSYLPDIRSYLADNNSYSADIYSYLTDIHINVTDNGLYPHVILQISKNHAVLSPS